MKKRRHLADYNKNGIVHLRSRAATRWVHTEQAYGFTH